MHSRPSQTSMNVPRCSLLMALARSIFRGAMLDGLRSVPGGNVALLFVLQFHGSPSSYLWDDDEGETHEIKQGEGGEEGDALMPFCALGQHQVLQVVQT